MTWVKFPGAWRSRRIVPGDADWYWGGDVYHGSWLGSNGTLASAPLTASPRAASIAK
jgi:hypothetical protein